MTIAENLRRLDAGSDRRGPMVVRLNGDALPTLPDPADMPFDEVLTTLHIGLIAPDHIGFTLGQVEALYPRWVAHFDLPSFADAQRLAYVVDRYADDLAYDLRVYASMDLAEMWRTRRWRTLLRTIDRIPGHSLYAEAVSMDEEHAEMLAASMAEREGAESDAAPGGPALRTWTPELKALTEVIDGVRRVEWAVIAAAGKGAPKPPEPLPRPSSLMAQAMKKAETKRRLKAHQNLTQRLLPHKRPDYVAPTTPALPPGWKHNAAGRLVDERGKYAKLPQ